MPLELILTIAATITAIGVIIGGIVSIYRIARRISQSIGLDSKGRTLSERLEKVEHQLWENGGSSLADRVNTIEEHAIKTSAELTIIKEFVLNSNVTPIASAPKKTRVRKIAN
jgi:biopolymer transport protein ExbB/TolQ